MIKELPLFVGGQPSSDLINSGLPEFRWEELCDKEEIGRGRIGAVFTAKSRGEVVVIKKLFWQNACEKRLFLKEAKILKDQSHDHVVRVKGFCANPLAIISLFRSWTFWCEFLCHMSSVQAKFFTIDGSYFFYSIVRCLLDTFKLQSFVLVSVSLVQTRYKEEPLRSVSVSILLIFHLIDRKSLLMFIPR